MVVGLWVGGDDDHDDDGGDDDDDDDDDDWNCPPQYTIPNNKRWWVWAQDRAAITSQLELVILRWIQWKRFECQGQQYGSDSWSLHPPGGHLSAGA